MFDFYDRRGEEISEAQWTRLRADQQYRLVAESHVRAANGDCVGVLTEWVGAVIPVVGESVPWIFGTRLFGGVNDKYVVFHRSAAEAVRRHDAMVDALATGKPIHPI